MTMRMLMTMTMTIMIVQHQQVPKFVKNTRQSLMITITGALNLGQGRIDTLLVSKLHTDDEMRDEMRQ